jgi:dCTP deaminase
MSVLSDRTIRALCIPPVTVFDEDEYQRLTELQNSRGWPLLGLAVDQLRSELIQQATRAATPEELEKFVPMISPFSPELIRRVEDRKIISMGTTSYGYDVSLTEDVKIFTNTNALEIDPKRFDEEKCLLHAEVCTDVDGGRFIRIPPHSYMLGSTREYFRIPRDVMVVCVGKSTYARSGVVVNTTPIEPGFEGNVVIEIANTTPLPARIYLGEGISQFMFFRGDEPCEVSYGDRGGKYQGQTGVTMPKV